MKIKDISLSKEDIKNKIEEFNKIHSEIITRANIIVKVVNQCSYESDKTLI